jgi:DNA end-binding protein Ku
MEEPSMPQAIWKGSIRFGLVNIPVALYPAESPATLDLDLLDRRDMARVGYDRVNKSTGRKVASADVVKGYEVSDGRYVVVTDQDLKKAAPEATQTVDIVAFVKAEEVSPIYFDKPYYLAPLSKGDKAYALLREALKRSERIAIANLVVRTRGYVAAVYPQERALVVQLLHYAHELRDPEDLDLPPAGTAKLGITAKELELADRLIEGMVEAWKPEVYKDDYRDQLLALIRKKAKSGGKAVVEEEEEEEEAPRAEVVDLMALLKESVSGKRKGSRAPSPAKAAKTPKAAKVAKARPKRATGSSRTTRRRSG